MKNANVTKLYLISRALDSLANSIMFTTYALYYINMLHLTPLQLLLVGTAVEVSVVLFEVPTGVVADSYSRRLSVLIGTVGMAAAYLLEGSVPYLSGLLPLFWGVVVAEVVRGIGWTFISGARSAWLADEIGTDRIGPVFMRAGKIGRIAGLVGIPVSVFLADFSLNLPFLVGGLLYVALFAIQWAMPETGFKPKPREGRSPFRLMADTFTSGTRAVRGNPVLIALLVIALIGGAASEGFDRLREAHVLLTFSLESYTQFTVAQWWGLIAGAGTLLGIGMAQVSERRLDLSDSRRLTAILLVTSSLQVALLLTFAFAPGLVWAIAALLALRMLGAIHEPVKETWMNQQVGSEVRATVLSMVGQMDAIGQSGGGPVVGWVGTRYTLRAALAMAGLLLSPALAVYGWAMRRSGPGSGGTAASDAAEAK